MHEKVSRRFDQVRQYTLLDDGRAADFSFSISVLGAATAQRNTGGQHARAEAQEPARERDFPVDIRRWVHLGAHHAMAG